MIGVAGCFQIRDLVGMLVRGCLLLDPTSTHNRSTPTWTIAGSMH
jgi:hypothetical protein